MNHLQIEIVDSPEKAPNYVKDHPEVKSAELTKAIVVLNGTQSGGSTVDLQFVTKEGTVFVAMTTGAILKQLGNVIQGAESR